jgi:hypothetical protein
VTRNLSPNQANTARMGEADRRGLGRPRPTDEEELRIFATAQPGPFRGTRKHLAWIDCWRERRIRFEIARAAGRFRP